MEKERAGQTLSFLRFAGLLICPRVIALNSYE